jgi:hypothetical protein
MIWRQQYRSSNERETIDIRIEPETIGHILKDGRKLFVPVNQRSYNQTVFSIPALPIAF